MKALLLIIILFVFISCDKDDSKSGIDWNTVKTGVINNDESLIEPEISKLLIDTKPKPTNEDEYGQLVNMNNLCAEINKSRLMTVEKNCYCCIQTYPPQTEITITTDSSGVTIKRILDILTPEDKILKFVEVHNYCY